MMMSALGDVRALRALNARRQGRRLIDIATTLDVSKERARQLVGLGLEVERRMESGDPWFELDARTRNCLVGDGCEPTIVGVERHYEAVADLKHIPYLGVKSIARLQAWLIRHGGTPLS
jgi:hypothetical protein